MATATPLPIIGALLVGAIPCEGAKCVPFAADFNAATTYVFDFTQPQQSGQISTIQCVFIDNSLNASNVVVTVDGSQQRFQVAANSCGFYTLLAPSPTVVRAASAGAVLVQFDFMNFYVPPTVWIAAYKKKPGVDEAPGSPILAFIAL